MQLQLGNKTELRKWKISSPNLIGEIISAKKNTDSRVKATTICKSSS